MCSCHIVNEGKPLTLKKLIEEDKVWYNIKLPTAPDLIFSYIIRDSVKFVYNEEKCIVRDNFYSIYSNVSSLLLFALLNNYHTFLQLELRGKKYGNGVLKIQTYDLNEIHIPDVSLITEDDVNCLEELSKNLIKSSNTDYIDKITTAISKYYPTSNPKDKYIDLKTN